MTSTPTALFCSPTPLSAKLGASKVYLETAEAFRRIGWRVTVVGPAKVAGERIGEPQELRSYLRRHGDEYDVVEFEHHALPFRRDEFPPRPLLVARSVLLTHTVHAAGIPLKPTFRARLGWVLFRRWQLARRRSAERRRADLTLQAADVVNLCNTDERSALLAIGLPAEKLLVRPFGLFPERFAAFRPEADELPDPPRVAFVGTFDPRKGMCEWPVIAAEILAVHPSARFRLLGTAGMVRTAGEVGSFFPAHIRSHLEVVAEFEPNELPARLGDCSVGVFPSYCEGFPFGVLEMLAAGLPVVAYRAPGLPMMLPTEDLVPVGDGRALGRRVAELLTGAEELRRKRRTARARAGEFDWLEIARGTAEAYRAATLRRGEVRGGLESA